MQYNKSPISMREGRAFIDGVEVLDSIKLEAKVTPDVWTGRQLGEKSPSSRWLGWAITGTMTRRRSTNFLRQKLKEYKDRGETPEMTIQGIMDDPNSDYYKAYGRETVTLVGCVITGDINLLNLDSEGQVVDDAIGFNAKDFM